MKKFYVLLFIVFLCFTAISTQAQWRIRSVLFNPPGTNNGREFIEIQGPPNTALTGLTFLEIDGDAAASGSIDRATNLSAFTTGSNGLLLIRDAATALVPAPEAATSVAVADFNPDLENGTVTYMVVSGFTGSAGDDLDVANDGVLDGTPWTALLSSVSVRDAGSADQQYAGANNVGSNPGALPNIVFYFKDRYNVANINGVDNGPFTINTNRAWFGPTGSVTVDATLNGIEITPGRSAAILPATLIGFNAGVFGKKVQLSWQTASESNTDRFEVQRSTNGVSYETIGSLKAAGQSNVVRQYSFIDQSPKGANLYYRLRMVDFDNTEKFSRIAKVKFNGGRVSINNLYPSPARNSLSMEWNSLQEGQARISITNISGQLLMNKTVTAMKGYNITTLDIERLATGQYILRLEVGNEVSTEKFIKQ